ncbi:MAG TPA: phosphopantetheine-binding protein [Gemmatimonadaceae bacterium]|nr:phosphopantetheine-binding protein [Gemmatimonadaceae bacterium]
MEISENDLWILSYYRESELAGGLVMGRLARETDDDDLRVHLTEHCAEEAHHAWLWTETILKVGGTPKRVAETYQTRYYAEIGMPASLLEILTLTQVFERRVIRHFRAHLKWPNVHPAVAETLHRMIEDEVGHISWVKDRLDRYAAERGEAAVAETMRRFTEVDERVYEAAMRYRDTARELLDPVLRGNGQVPPTSKAAVTPTASPPTTNNTELRHLVAKSLGVSDDLVLDASSLRDLGVNSLDLVVLVMSIEEHFHIEFEPSDLERLRTFADLAHRVAELAEQR